MKTGTMAPPAGRENRSNEAVMSDASLDRDFRELLARAQQGCEDAARELYDTYGAHVLRCVRNRMWRRLRSKFDSQDFVQSVFKSFFHDGSKLPDFQTPADLIAYLRSMAEAKVNQESRRRRELKRDATRELPLDVSSEPSGPHPTTRLPTPSTVAIFRERYERVVERHPETEREVADLRLEGNTFPEIGEKLDMDPSHARKILRRLKRRTSRSPNHSSNRSSKK